MMLKLFELDWWRTTLWFVDAVGRLTDFYRNERCGQCMPCGEWTGYLLDYHEHALGNVAAWPIQSLIRHFISHRHTHSRKMAWRLQLLNSSGPTMWKSYIPPLFSLHLRISQSFSLDSVWYWWNNILQHATNIWLL